MLKEANFHAACESGKIPQKRTIRQKAELLFQLFEQQVETLIANRKKRLKRQRKALEDCHDSDFIVDQSTMVFVP